MIQFTDINHLSISVNDKDQARKFYEGVLVLEYIIVANKHHWLKIGNQNEVLLKDI